MGSVRKGRTISAFTFLVSHFILLFTACSAEHEAQQDTAPVAVELAFTVAKSADKGTTRMLSDNVDGTSGNVNITHVIPFAITGSLVEATDKHKETPLIRQEFTLAQTKVNDAFFYNPYCNFEPGVNAVLAYGRDKLHNPGAVRGALNETFTDDMEPSGIRFELQPISSGTQLASNAKAVALTTYLSNIANASIAGESSKTFKSLLETEYTKFINTDNKDLDGKVLPGSSANIKQWVSVLKAEIGEPVANPSTDEEKIKKSIYDAIAAAKVGDDDLGKFNTDWKDFPSTMGLPDGAAVLRWIAGNNRFEYEQESTTMGDINGVDRFAYPAEIYYYGNSTIKVSRDNQLNTLKDASKDWSEVLEQFTDGSSVSAEVKSVAMENPLQYGVAKLQVKIGVKDNAISLKDHDNSEMTVGSNFELTGIIVGGQLPVGFDFRPQSVMDSYSETDMKFIYDKEIKKDSNYPCLSSTSEIGPTNTLVLQSYDGKELRVALEFLNKGDAFKGHEGNVVYSGTKFYLMGTTKKFSEITYEEGVSDKVKGRVFTQDHTTTLNITVSDLKNAYNVLPDMMSPRLEMGIELTPEWVQATTTDVIL